MRDDGATADAGASASGGDAPTGGSTPADAPKGGDGTPKDSGAPNDGHPGAGRDPADGVGGSGKLGRPTDSSGDAFDQLAREAYERGRQLLDPSTVIAGRDAHVTVRTQLVLTDRSGPPRTPGRLRAEQLEAVRASYVEGPEYATLKELLFSRHLLVLVGTPGSGRSTTAIRLLDDVTDGTVARLDPAVPAVDLDPEAIAKGHGYLGIVAEKDSRSSTVAADRFADRLEHAGTYCVLVVTEQTDAATAFAAYATTCTPPDPHELVEQHVDAGLGPQAPPDLGPRLLGLAESPRLHRALGPEPRTHEAAALARLLLAHGRGEIGVDDVEAALAALLDDQIAQWFAVLDAPPHGDRGERARRLSALRIALAVFDGLPAYLATNAAAQLSVRLTAPFAHPSDDPPTVPPTRSPVLTGEDDRMLVVSTRLRREWTTAPFNGFDVPAEVVRFADPRTPAALLRHVWTERPVLRRPLLAWLGDLARDPRPVVRTRAAQAAGLLCSVDFAHTFTELIRPNAEKQLPAAPTVDSDEEEDGGPDREAHVAEVRRRREFAALAMDHAARNPAVRRVVLRTLRRWASSDDNPALRNTAANALGYDVGQADLEKTLEKLKVLGTPGQSRDLDGMKDRATRDDWFRLVYLSGESVARLFTTGAHHRVLQALDNWMTHQRVDLRLLAVQAIVLMMDARVSELGRPEQDDDDTLVAGGDLPPDRARWPALLALQDRHPDVVAPAAELVREALRSRWRDVVATVLTRWFDLAASDEAALPAVESFLPRLVVEESDRARLRGLVRRSRRTWADPLPPHVADRLDDALAHAAAAPPGGRIVYT